MIISPEGSPEGFPFGSEGSPVGSPGGPPSPAGAQELRCSSQDGSLEALLPGYRGFGSSMGSNGTPGGSMAAVIKMLN